MALGSVNRRCGLAALHDESNAGPAEIVRGRLLLNRIAGGAALTGALETVSSELVNVIRTGERAQWR